MAHMRSRSSTPPRVSGNGLGTSSASSSTASANASRDTVDFSPRKAHGARLAPYSVDDGPQKHQRGRGRGLTGGRHEDEFPRKRRPAGLEGRIRLLVEQVVNGVTARLRSSRRRSVIIIALLLTLLGWYTFSDSPTDQVTFPTDTSPPIGTGKIGSVGRRNSPPPKVDTRSSRRRDARKGEGEKKPTPARRVRDEAPGVWKHAYQETLPRRLDYLTPASEWAEENRTGVLKELKRIRRAMPERWPVQEREVVDVGTDEGEEQIDNPNSELAQAGSRAVKKATLDALDRLIFCFSASDESTCSPEETEVVILSHPHFSNALATDPEDIATDQDFWARSIIDSFGRLGHTVLFAEQLLEVLDLYTAIPDMVKVVIMDPPMIDLCEQWGVLAFEGPLDEVDLALGAKVTELQIYTASDSLIDAMRNPTRAAVKEAQAELRPGQKLQAVGHVSLRGQVFSDSKNKLKRGHDDYELHEEYRCVKGRRFELGIPPWKMFGLQTAGMVGDDSGEVAGEAASILGHLWTLAPDEKRNGAGDGRQGGGWEQNFYLGYTVEPYVPAPVQLNARMHRGFLLAHDVSDFDDLDYKYPDGFFDEVSARTGLEFVAPLANASSVPSDQGVTSLGSLITSRYLERIRRSKVLIDIGRPSRAVTPFMALRMGVPYVNQVTKWSARAPENRRQWKYSQGALSDIEPPHVYTVMHGNATQLQEAIEAAIQDPIEPFSLPDMTEAAVTRRHATLMSTDWRMLAKKRVDEMLLVGQFGLEVTFEL